MKPNPANYGCDYFDKWGRGPLLAYFQDSNGIPPHVPRLDRLHDVPRASYGGPDPVQLPSRAAITEVLQGLLPGGVEDAVGSRLSALARADSELRQSIRGLSAAVSDLERGESRDGD